MESRKVGVYRLFIIVGIFSASIFFLNNNKKKITTQTHIDLIQCKKNSIAKLSLEHAYEQMNSLFVARDTDLIVKVVSQFKDRCMYKLVERIVQEPSSFLSPEEKMEILFGLVAHCGAKKSNTQYDLFDFLLKYPILHKDTPALLVLARSKYADSIAQFINWGKDRQKNEGRTGLLTAYVEQAFTTAIADNDCAAVETMFSKKVRLAQSKASAFLWDIVENNKNSALIPLLVHHAQADVNCIDCAKTLLIAAVEKNNVEMIRALLDEGAVVDRVIDAEKGSALHIAMKNNYASVEQLLREYGAA
jgi:hypothetical protein